MRATIGDLRYRMHEILKALGRNERVSIFYHGQLKGILTAAPESSATQVTEHPFFNMKPSQTTVEEEMETLRGGRHRALI